MTKEEFIQLQTDRDNLVSLLASGMEIDSASEDLAEMDANLESAQWEIDMDAHGGLANRVIAKPQPAKTM